jgi:hypothetical protein
LNFFLTCALHIVMVKIAAALAVGLGLGLIDLGSAQRLSSSAAKIPVVDKYSPNMGNGTIPCDVEQLIAAHEGNKLCAVRAREQGSPTQSDTQ